MANKKFSEIKAKIRQTIEKDEPGQLSQQTAQRSDQPRKLSQEQEKSVNAIDSQLLRQFQANEPEQRAIVQREAAKEFLRENKNRKRSHVQERSKTPPESQSLSQKFRNQKRQRTEPTPPQAVAPTKV